MGRGERGIGECSVAEITAVLAAHQPDTGPSERAGRHAAVAMVLREGPGGRLETLFIQRTEHPGDPWSGQMAFPGGRRDAQDASVEAAARRETFEEVGIDLTPATRVGRLDDIEGGRLSTFRLSVSPFVFHYPDPPAVTLEEREVADSVWVPLAYLGDVGNVVPYQFPQDPAGREFPSFQYEGYPIWGLTFRIITSFVRLFGVELPREPRMTGED